MATSETKIKLSKDGSVHVTDEFYNTLISSVGAFLTLVGVVYLAYHSHLQNKPWHMMGFLAYGFGVMSVFITSAMHHGIDSSEKVEFILKELDYFAITFMIAGTFTPFCLILFRETMGWNLLYMVWGLALVGVFLKALFPRAPKWIIVLYFFAMAALAFFMVEPIYLVINFGGLAWLVAGGALFVFGSGIYYFERPNPAPGRFGFHEIWHLFVVAGAFCHYMVMLLFLLPYPG